MLMIFQMKFKTCYSLKALSKLIQVSSFAALNTAFVSVTFAENLSYVQAEQYLLENSYTTQANQALNQASKLQAEAVKNIGLPRIDLNVRAYKFHTETDIDPEMIYPIEQQQAGWQAILDNFARYVENNS
jgi:hypothetical protein